MINQLFLFRFLVSLAIIILIIRGPYNEFSVYSFELFNGNSAISAIFLPSKYIIITLLLAQFANKKLCPLFSSLAAVIFLVFNWYAANSSPSEMYNYNTHLNIFLIAIAIGDIFMAMHRDVERYVFSFSRFYVAVFYFQSGITKIIHAGFEWFDGRTAWVFSMEMGTPLGKYMTNYPELFAIGSIAIVLFEVMFLPLYLIRFHVEKLVIGAFMLHMSVFIIMNITFWHMWMIFPALFYRELSDYIRSWIKRDRKSPKMIVLS
ncbi:hypothetical protein FLM06_09495 [Vibrio cholerae]|uniref:hypothetical protein n=1 Tax=Vibrio cholerae TaxID=666 RepID=UPI00115BADBE|nr:hypothetical protein [Vibrio cholerae]TQO82821.1 hypothetical protein FLM06_09495 [Vibrio cholerae]TQP15047.1 hypothetical protein FLM03_02655 [Vibrio cholerae]TQP27046.1 hypothetical protein FLL94_06875 [Vibrio cholerae]TQP45148.1 hypothetical protein FLL99_13255 [Vibrio cholerae]